jgi:hypothetical protein
MPSPEQNQYSNKQSTKVNAGLCFGAGADQSNTETSTTSEVVISNSYAPTMDIDFSQLVVPIQLSSKSSAAPPVEQLVRILVHPPQHAFLHGVLSIQWVIGATGQSHFHFRYSDERYILAPGSSVRTEGTRLGLPPVYMEWLCGEEEESSPTEQGMLLTRKFFEGLRKEGFWWR